MSKPVRIFYLNVPPNLNEYCGEFLYESTYNSQVLFRCVVGYIGNVTIWTNVHDETSIPSRLRLCGPFSNFGEGDVILTLF